MKRLREDGFVYSQDKRRFRSSLRTSIEKSKIPGGGGGSHMLESMETYLNEVRDAFREQTPTYKMFQNVMREFKAQRIDTTDLMVWVKKLFNGHDNLIIGFNTFLPKGYEITLTNEDEEEEPKNMVQLQKAIDFVNNVQKRFRNNDRVYKSFIYIVNLYRAGYIGIQQVYHKVTTLFIDHLDLLEEFMIFFPKESSGRVSTAHHPIDRHPFHHYDGQISVMPTLQDRLIEEDKNEGKKSYLSQQHYRQDRINSPHPDHVLSVQHTDSDDYKKLHKNQGKSAAKKSNKRRNFDQDYRKSEHQMPRDFNMPCLPEKEKSAWRIEDLGGNSLASYDDRDALKKTLWNKDDTSISVNIEDEYMEQEHVMDGDREKDIYNEKYIGKSIHELDLSNCQHCGHSYWLLPEDYPIPSTSGRSELGDQVLNNRWVSVTSGSEDYSFKHMRRNQYDEILSVCDDDRYELDMLLKSVRSTAMEAEKLLHSVNDDPVNPETPIRIEDKFTALNLRCIERLYGDHGLDVMDILRKDPSVALPVILARLKQKQEEWTKCHSDFNKVWGEVYAKNHYKSLEHHSIYLKQQGPKNFSTKSVRLGE
ncbi:paired amphipathic helix protein Sin3-like 2 isoform X2 [Cornus florida]|uniref:paired amphipathic helix protein Sin3-like 2 isoform X2 n=1 Tax=Cornus florida TaxID=4283 RepID=UPI0028969031|nr:paired amphipathic helix protein Sin3-like 2 isoform X2 [Cornus florida]